MSICLICQNIVFHENDLARISCPCIFHAHCLMRYNDTRVPKECPKCRVVWTPSEFQKTVTTSNLKPPSHLTFKPTDSQFEICPFCYERFIKDTPVKLLTCECAYHHDCLKIYIDEHEEDKCNRCEIPITGYDRLYYSKSLSQKQQRNILKTF